MSTFAEALLILVFVGVIVWRNRQLLLAVLPIVTNPRRIVNFVRFFWTGRSTWFEASGADGGQISPEERKTRRNARILEIVRTLAGYGLAMFGAGLYVNDVSKILGIILSAVAIIVIPSRYQM
jgi:hypothetical protein